MIRKLLLLALVLVAVAGIAACGDEATDETTPASTPTAAEPTTPASTPTQSADDPAALFADNCSGCHGTDGSGGNGPDLRGEDNVAGIAEQVREGGGGMPSFSGQLTDAQIEALAEYVAAEL